MKCDRIWFLLAALAGVVGVAMGAYAAHGLNSLPDTLRQAAQVSMHSAVNYNMFHALALLGVALWFRFGHPSRLLLLAGVFFTIGILLFSGLIYYHTLSQTRALIHMVPMGGFSFILGWIFLGMASLRERKPQA